MSKQYFYRLGVSFFGCVLIIASYLILTRPMAIEQVATKNQYQSYVVDGPIQPIPTLVSVDHPWVNLGEALFHSPLLSKDNSISCASCHLINYGGDDGFPVSLGVDSRSGERNSPTVLNAVFNFRQFWDGRSANLSEQASGPIHNPVEMGSNWSQILTKLEQSTDFKKAFSELGVNPITETGVIKAITAYEETLITPNSPLDLYLKGDTQALSAQQKSGLNKFTQFGCITCHQGQNLGGNLFQKLGRIDLVPEPMLQDKGRFNLTGEPTDMHVYKVPSLRNVAETAPYFHNGSVATLNEAVNIMAKAQLGMELTEEDTQDLVAFLHSLSAPVDKGVRQ